MKDPNPELCSALDEIGNCFRKDELAYLVITSKSEHPFRDRLAYLLHKRYEADGYVVAREWAPELIDLAVLRPDGQPICLIELKMMYTFDAIGIKESYDFREFTRKDIEKAQRKAQSTNPQAAVFSLLLAAHPTQPFDQRYHCVLKYKLRTPRSTGPKLLEAAIRAVNEGFEGRNIVHRGEVPGGTIFGSDVTVLFWLVGG